MFRNLTIVALGFLLGGLMVGGASYAAARSGGSAPSAKAPLVQHVRIVAQPDSAHAKKGPDGKWHDVFLPANFSVEPGAKVVVTVVNHDDMPHSFTSPSLHVNAVIRMAMDMQGGKMMATTTTFVFRAPLKPGRYLWWCAKPCDAWAMGHVGYMRGYVTVER